MADFVFNIISNHKTGNDYKSFLKLLSIYPETINENYQGLSLHEAFILNDNKENKFSFPELSIKGKQDKVIEEKYNEQIYLNKQKHDLLEYILLHKNNLEINYETFSKIVRQHYSCTGLALKFVEQGLFENQEEPPLHFAVKNNYYKLVHLLLSSGYNIFNKDKKGNIALYYVQDIETFKELTFYYNFQDKDKQSIYKDCIENIFKNTVIKKRAFLEYMLSYFSKNKLPKEINDIVSLLLVTEHTGKLINKYANIFNNNHNESIKSRDEMYPLAFGSLYFISNPSHLNYKGMFYYQHLKNQETVPGIKDGFLAHLAFFSDKMNIHSAFFKPESNEQCIFMSFFHDEYKNKDYYTFIKDLGKALTFFKDNISINYISEKNVIKHHHSISKIFDKHFKVNASNPLPPFFNNSLAITDDFLEHLLIVFDLYRESNIYLAEYYVQKKQNKNDKENFIYYGGFNDNGADKIILSYILKVFSDELTSYTHFNILKYCFRQCELLYIYSQINERHEKNLNELSFIIKKCLSKLDSNHIEELSLQEEKYTQIIIEANLKNINLTGIIMENKYASIIDYSPVLTETLQNTNSKNRI